MLRIEDTDKERSERSKVESIINSLKWLGIDHDGDISYQSNNIDIYQKYVEILLNKGRAYYCFCSNEEFSKSHSWSD